MGFRDQADPRRRRSRPGHRRTGGADLPDDVVRVPRFRARRQPVRSRRGRQHLHPDHEPDAGCARGSPQRSRRAACTTAIGHPGDAARVVGAGGRDAGVADPVRVGRPRRRVGVAVRRHLQPAALHAAQAGHQVTFVDDPHDLSTWGAAIQDNTKVFFGEVLPNPKNDVFDIDGVCGVAHAHGIPLMVDNTVATPYLIRPIEHGADIVVHSLTKFIGGHGTSIGGAIVDGGTFDFGASGRFPNFTEPDPSYHGLAYWPALGHGSFILKARVQLLRDLGHGDLTVQRVPVPAGPRDAEPAHGASLVERAGGRRVPRRSRPGRVGAATRACRRARGTSGPEVRRRQGLRRRSWRSRSSVVSRPARVRRGARRCTATSPTSATCAAS